MPRKVRNVPNVGTRSSLPMNGPSMLESAKSGFGLGLGMEAARVTISSIFAPSNSGSTSSDTECKFERQLIFQCLQEQTMDSPNTCQDVINLYRQCNQLNHNVDV